MAAKANGVVVTIGLVLLIGSACAGKEKPQAQDFLQDEDQPVTLFGLDLNQQASPQQVSWALLMALREDVSAGRNLEARKEAWKKQCQLANQEVIRTLAAQILSQRKQDPNEFVFEVITGWGPIVAYYAQYFDEEFEQDNSRMNVTPGRLPASGLSTESVDVVHVEYDLKSESRNGPRGLHIGVRIRMSLAKTEKGLWRVFRVAFGKSPDIQG